MNSLANYAVDRDNNFNLIRFIAATLVLFSHSYPLALGRGVSDPLGILIGVSLGEIAVDIFFITSGFLVTQSLTNRPSLKAFFLARILRIFPALVVAMLFCVFVVGVAFTHYAVSDYIFHEQTYIFLKKNFTLLFGIRYELPGVFEQNTYPGAVNGSIWTLPWELKMYLVLGFAALLGRQYKWVLIGAIGILGMFGYLIDHLVILGGLDTDPNKPRFLAFFFAGSLCYLFRQHIYLNNRIFLSISALLVFLLLLRQQQVFFILYALSLAYLVLCLAYIPNGAVRKFNQLGDYSYGIYIYAFPVQQSISALFPGIGVISMFLLAFPVTLLLGIFSWYFIEKPCLRLKSKYLTDC